VDFKTNPTLKSIMNNKESQLSTNTIYDFSLIICQKTTLSQHKTDMRIVAGMAGTPEKPP
jgi:hypothetical protein